MSPLADKVHWTERRSVLKLAVTRLVLLAGIVQVTEFGCIALITYALETPVRDLFSKPLAALLPFVVPAILAAFAVYWLGVRIIEKRRVRELALDQAFSYFALGAGTGFLLFGSVFGTLWDKGYATYEGYLGLDELPSAALIFAANVVFEELVFRGAIFRIVEDSLGTTLALAVSALLFGLSHLANNGATLVSALSVAVAGGITFGLTYTLTKSLWLPMGIHFGWNFTQGAVFGSAVSGYEPRGALKFRLAGPSLVTGGAFGPEASVYTILFAIILAAGLCTLAYRRGRWIKLHFQT